MEDFLWGLWNGISAWPVLIVHVFDVWEQYPVYNVGRDTRLVPVRLPHRRGVATPRPARARPEALTREPRAWDETHRRGRSRPSDQCPSSSMRSSNSALLSRFTPGLTPPLDFETGSGVLGCSLTLRRRASDSRSASSTTAFSVRPERAATAFTSASNSSSIVTVVLMHQSACDAHQDVNARRAPYRPRTRTGYRR